MTITDCLNIHKEYYKNVENTGKGERFYVIKSGKDIWGEWNYNSRHTTGDVIFSVKGSTGGDRLFSSWVEYQLEELFYE